MINNYDAGLRMLAIASFALAITAVRTHAQNLSTSCNLQAAQVAVQQRDNYGALKDLEGCFQLPANSVTTAVGTFDPVTGNFSYSSQVTQRQIPLPLAEISVPLTGGKPGLTGSRPEVRDVPHLVGILPANAVNVSLSFQSANGGAIPVSVKQLQATWSQVGGAISGVSCGVMGPGCPWSVTALPANWSSSGAPATVNVGKAVSVEFTIGSGAKTFTGYLLIVRPPVIGVGAFIVPAIPLTIVYAPPLGQQKKNNNGYSLTTSAGTALSMTVSQDDSTTTPMNFLPVGPVFANDVQNSLSKIPGLSSLPFGSALTGEVGIINQITGSLSGTTTQGLTTTQNHTLNILFQSQSSWTTGDLVGGPGLEDIFVFLKNAQFMWEAYGGRLSVSMIKADFDTKAAHYLLENKDNPQGFDGLDSKTIKSLLALDPFTARYVNVPYSPAMATINGIVPIGQPANALPPSPAIPSRLVDLGAQDLGQSDQNPYKISNSYTVSQSDSTANANYSSSAIDAKAGMLSFLGTGSDITVTQSQNSKTIVTATTTSTDTQTVSASATIYFAQNEVFDAEEYYDPAMGTFAFVPQPSSSTASLAGTAVNALGQPLARQVVELQIGSRKYMTKTDAQGRYTFHSAGIKSGMPGLLVIGSIRKQIQIGLPVAIAGPLRPK